jgi:hypothetical protein
MKMLFDWARPDRNRALHESSISFPIANQHIHQHYNFKYRENFNFKANNAEKF